MDQSPLRIGITIGDPAGIGAEVALKALVYWHGGNARFSLVGPRKLWRASTEAVSAMRPDLRSAFEGVERNVDWIETPDPEADQPLKLGETSARCGAIARDALAAAVNCCLRGELDAIVTAPLSKEGLSLAGCEVPGHTELLRDLTDSQDTTMALVGGNLRVALVTIHLPLSEVPRVLTSELVVRKARHLKEFLRLRGLSNPSIGLCGLNPHAGEAGLFGKEERDVLLPAVEELRAEGIRISDPVPADTIYYETLGGKYDAVLALYHDQGLIPIKTLAFNSAVNVTLGLPLIRTSPDHGTAFDIAGRGLARPGSMTAALRLAVDLARHSPRLRWQQ